jgi:hypothetical protein
LAAKHFGGKKFWRQKILAAKNFAGKTFWRQNILAAKHFGGKTFWRQKNKNFSKLNTLAQASLGKPATADTDPQ